MTCALREMMLNGQSADAVAYLFPKLFSALLLRLGSSVGVQLPKDLNSNSIISDRKTTNKNNVAYFDVCGWVAYICNFVLLCLFRVTMWTQWFSNFLTTFWKLLVFNLFGYLQKLGILIYTKLTMIPDISRTCSSWFYVFLFKII